MAACCVAFAQADLTTREAAERRQPDFTPSHLGRTVRVRGRVCTRPVHILELYIQVGIEQHSYGLVLETPRSDARMDTLAPGDDVEASGTIRMRGGLPVLAVSDMRVLGRSSPPAPVPLSIAELQAFRNLGRLAVTEGRIVEIGENTGGAYMLIGDTDNPYKLFLPLPGGRRDSAFGGFAVGDKVRATGLASQYCPTPPYGRWFQLTIVHAGDVVRTDRGLPVSPRLLVAALVGAALLGLGLAGRERRLRTQREMLRRAYQLGEEVMGASSAVDIACKTTAVLPLIFGVTRAHLYLHNLGAKSLEKVPTSPGEEPVPIALASPKGGVEAGLAACFHNHRLLAVPDMSRSPFAPADSFAGAAPRACMFVPMFAQGETVGVFELDQDNRFRLFSPDEQALAQHLGNQMGVALKLLDQRSVREQLFRTEKLAAMGRLISGVVNELQAPLSSIRNLADHALASGRQGRPPEHWGRDLEAVAEEARKARDIVQRLVAFSGTEQVEARPVNLNALVRSLAEFRDREWKSRGIRMRALISDEPLSVLGSEGQLEEVLLALIVHAEQCVAEAADKQINIRTTRLARHGLVEIGYSGQRGGPDPFAAAAESAGATLSLGICRSIAASHGGELRAIQSSDADPRFELELPLTRRRPAAQPHDARVHDMGRPLTALTIEPDDAVERHLLALLSARGYRVVPVASADAGLDLAQRLRFEVAFCSVRAPGLNWVELSERLQAYVSGFVLLGEGYDPELAADFEGEGRFVLSKPIDEHRFGEILQRVEAGLKSRSYVG
jgi:GAF domain-containing protein/CheY-like chemotaxis protein